MRYIILLFLCFAIIITKGQSILKFDTKLIDSEDKWISLPMNKKDSTYIYGFVYLDNLAGLTFHLEGKYTVSKEGEIKLKKQAATSVVKQRLSPTNVKVAVIPDSLYGKLEIAHIPNWLSSYRTTDNDINRLFRLGFTHNAWNEPEKALVYLDKVKQTNSNYRGLDFEIAFAYNALKKYDKASVILEEALKTNPNECLLYKELIYAQINLKQVEKAIEFSKSALDLCKDKNTRSEILRNIVYHFYSRGDEGQFKLWANKAREEMVGNVKALQVISKWEVELNK